MSGVIQNDMGAAFQGFSISQPFLGAALQFYPEMGTQQLDDLINAYVSGSASISEKRATVSMDFFAYSQLTGETFKYYAVDGQSLSNTTSSAGSSPIQGSSYSSNFVSPVISDWSWSRSTSSSGSVTTPTSVTHEAIPSKPSKKIASSAARHQASDFSHLPGMKIMTKDGRDVTNSASRGCKTKEQRDHAHLMRIIKACDACKKKKVRCDPSHKKRSATQSQSTNTGATPVRLAKKAKTSAKDSRTATERSPQQDTAFTAQSLVPEQPFASLEIPSNSTDLAEAWESLVQFDEEPVDFSPFNYDFFFDPAGHLTPKSNQSPATPSMVFAQLQSGADTQQNPDVNKPFSDELGIEFPTLPYLDSTAPANNYVDFNLYSPEPSFLDDDMALLTDIGSAIGRNQSTLSRHHSPAQDRSSTHLLEDADPSPVVPGDCLVVSDGATPGGSSLGGSITQKRRRHLIPRGGVRPASRALFGEFENLNSFTDEQSVSKCELSSQTNACNSFSAPQTVRSSHVTDGSLQTTTTQVLQAAASCPGSAQQGTVIQHTIATGAFSRILESSVTAPSSSVAELSRANIAATTTGSGNRRLADSGAASTSPDIYLQVSAPRLTESRNTPVSLSFVHSAPQVFGLSGVQSPLAMVDGFLWKGRTHVNKRSNSQLLVCTVLLATAFGFVSWLEVQTTVYKFLQVAFGLAMYNAYQSTSSHHDLRPQQSHLKPGRSLPGHTGKDVEVSRPRARVLMISHVDLQLGLGGPGLYG
ncbi:uncharacterized protein GLRG_04587 [Colletotrichum graminicola M1.001]|uniref:Zn(2)-C6 fungal-type domain-containing protein n=1 Tax=Colletotrichum graminicola (strain M1.001 / M2 / FGSC 10212) TaxID=645133 RepID=E3QF05_COLGM|nr:uncharacterized protein GLRG_04587 [Colletotrichum graminicola M1.001]EFQ29443.1 hypothetical protein GLRG_04587 [Colletotrichum graminicola M1.001]